MSRTRRPHRGRTSALLVLIILMLVVPAPALSTPLSSDESPGGGLGQGVDSAADGDRAMAKWTYLVYMSADNNLEDEAILNFNQMEMVGSSDELNIVVQFDRSPLYDETNGNWSSTRRYLVTTDTDPDLMNSHLIDDMGEVNMGNADRLRDFVVWGVANYPAERTYLDVWGHGGGWRDGTCNDYTSGSAIDTDELGMALAEAEALTNTTLAGLGFDQCLMAQMEVFYEIKARADVLVGAESLIPSEGYNYTRIMEALDADPDMDAHGLANLIVTAFFDEYGHDHERTHSATDAEALDAGLAPALTQLAQVLRGKADTLRGAGERVPRGGLRGPWHRQERFDGPVLLLPQVRTLLELRQHPDEPRAAMGRVPGRILRQEGPAERGPHRPRGGPMGGFRGGTGVPVERDGKRHRREHQHHRVEVRPGQVAVRDGLRSLVRERVH
jgi:hypothetical protein